MQLKAFRPFPIKLSVLHSCKIYKISQFRIIADASLSGRIFSLFRSIWQIWASDCRIEQKRGEMNCWLFAKLWQFLAPAPTCGENYRRTFCFPVFGQISLKRQTSKRQYCVFWTFVGLHCSNFHLKNIQTHLRPRSHKKLQTNSCKFSTTKIGAK